MDILLYAPDDEFSDITAHGSPVPDLSSALGFSCSAAPVGTCFCLVPVSQLLSCFPSHPSLRAQILQGSDVNLVSLISPSPKLEVRTLECDSMTVSLKASCSTSSKLLTFPEFCVAGGC
ncbi:hypothetical protein AAFF_G00328430 [Aldrovandia affinis]|uniref:Uncharacterized protein n=1 Tax=Aldrovandia affinis TaxID=143900 RepID=A0AAD7T9Q6_9TELE|nr:hypothetical protein AAFF_G00328430 [Aldrovandia affinis]